MSYNEVSPRMSCMSPPSLLSVPACMQSLEGENLPHYMVSTLHLYPPETLATMLDSGMNFALQDHDGYTPLMQAACDGDVSDMTALLGLSARLGRDVALGFGSVTAEDQYNVLHLVAMHMVETYTQLHCSMVVELLLDHPDMDDDTANAVDIFGQTPLHVAVRTHASVGCASAFLRSPKVFSGAADYFGNTPLHCLIESARCFYSAAMLKNHQFRPGYLKELFWKLLCWKAADDGAPVIDVFATNDAGCTVMELVKKLGQDIPCCEDMQCTLECVMHGRRMKMRVQGTADD